MVMWEGVTMMFKPNEWYWKPGVTLFAAWYVYVWHLSFTLFLCVELKLLNSYMCYLTVFNFNVGIGLCVHCPCTPLVFLSCNVGCRIANQCH